MRGHVLITGAGGFVGNRLARCLTELGYRVSGLDRRSDVFGSYSEYARCDLSDDASVARAEFSRRFDAIVHLAGVLPRQRTRGELFAINTGATSAVLHHFAHEACHVVFFSTGLVYGEQPGPFVEDMECLPRHPYAQSKLAAEGLVRSWARIHEARATVLRPSVLYGIGAPRDMLVSSLLNSLHLGEPVQMTAGEQLRDFLHVDDAVRAVTLVLERGVSGTFNLAAGASHSVREVAELMGRISGRADLLRMGALPYGPSEVFDYRLDPAALRSAVGFVPTHSLATGLASTWGQLS
jgi:nucleoside-diphosphate-sugar epimerase